MNLLAFGTDSYKQSHHSFYPEGLETVYSYCEPRIGGMFDEVVFFGLQYFISKYLKGKVVTRELIEEAAAVCEAHFGSAAVFNREGWEYILEKHGGFLPVRIKALPEGTVVPQGTCLFTIENTDPNVPWLTNFLETVLMQVWAPTTVASSSLAIKKIIQEYLDTTGGTPGLPFKLHDFGFRGVSSVETAALTGAAHLTSFVGTDNMVALELIRDYYTGRFVTSHEQGVVGYSIPASEHSVMTAGGPDGEADIVRRILKAYPDGLVAMVIDSYDTIGFIDDVIGGNPDILEAIKQREGTVIFRPDSGSLPEIDVDVFRALARVFGVQKNAKGYDVLPNTVRMIQGDGIKWYRTDPNWGTETWKHTVEDILAEFHANGISADNIAFGSGGGLLQKFDRDTMRFAIKCSAMQINGKWQDIYKQPKTDPTKSSKRGRLVVLRDIQGNIRTMPENTHLAAGWIDECDEFKGSQNLLQTVFENGRVTNHQTIEEIRDTIQQK